MHLLDAGKSFWFSGVFNLYILLRILYFQAAIAEHA